MSENGEPEIQTPGQAAETSADLYGEYKGIVDQPFSESEERRLDRALSEHDRPMRARQEEINNIDAKTKALRVAEEILKGIGQETKVREALKDALKKKIEEGLSEDIHIGVVLAQIIPEVAWTNIHTRRGMKPETPYLVFSSMDRYNDDEMRVLEEAESLAGAAHLLDRTVQVMVDDAFKEAIEDAMARQNDREDGVVDVAALIEERKAFEKMRGVKQRQDIDEVADYIAENFDETIRVLQAKQVRLKRAHSITSGRLAVIERETDEHIENVAKPFAKKYSGLLERAAKDYLDLDTKDEDLVNKQPNKDTDPSSSEKTD